MAEVQDIAQKKVRALDIDPHAPKLYSKAMWRNWFPVGAAILSLVACGYDQSISWNITNLASFNRDVVRKDAIELAAFQSVTEFAGMIAAVFMPLFYDLRGRKFAFCWGSVITIIGVLISFFGTLTDNGDVMRTLYYLGRLINVIGIDLTAGCSWMYAAELSHPAHRAFFGGLFGLCWQVGNFLNNLVIFIMAFTPDNSWQWKIPTLLQALFSIALLCMLPFLPETPRCLVAKGRREEAEKVVKVWVGCNIAEQSFIDDQMAELDEALSSAVPSETVWQVYNMKPLWATANSRRRVFYFLLTNAVIQLLNWGAQGGVFETLIYDMIGFGDSRIKAGLNLGVSALSFICSYVACMFLERWGRRRTYLVCYGIGFIFGWLQVAAFEGFALTRQFGYAALFIFHLFFSQTYNAPIGPVKLLFESELLAYDYRARGKALNDLTLKPANVASTFIQAAVLKALNHHTFLVAQGYGLFLLILYYFIMPETKGRTLEEVDEVFDHPSPFHTLFKPSDGPNYVKHSLMVLKAREEAVKHGAGVNIDTAVEEKEKKADEKV